MDSQVIGLLKATRREIERDGWAQGHYFGEHVRKKSRRDARE